MRKEILTCLTCLLFTTISAQKVYELSAPAHPMDIITGQLKISGTSPSGGSISANSYYLLRDSRPIIPVMGEFHYCRYPENQWEEQLMKMKAGGITVVSTYVFWNIHEPYEGKFRWEGDLNIRHFVELCQKHGLDVIVRIGPFDHGEIRNGGLPDWIYAKPIDVRSNDSLYLHYAKRLFSQIAEQLKGLYYKDGGPIIGIQIENEHQHAASTWAFSYAGHSEYTSASYDQAFTHFQISPDERKIATARLGDEHMMTLKKMAEDCGMIVPIYTATGWGNAATLGHDGLPVMAAYPYATWADITQRSPYCIFTDLRQKPDYSPVKFNPQDFPCVYAEMGCGIQMGYNARTIVDPRGVYTMLLRTIGSGSNGIGYYMYHGGSSPKMDGANAFYSDGDGVLPRISYDFQAPLGENGLEKESYRRLRMLHLFLADYQDVLAPMEVVLPENAKSMTTDNTDDLRYCARMSSSENSGFLFLINFQDHDTLRHDMKGLQMSLYLKGETLKIPADGTFCLPKNTNAIFPFNMKMGNAMLKYATAQPLMKFTDKGTEHYVFFVPEGMKAEYLFDKSTVKGKNLYRPEAGLRSTFSVKDINGKTIKITTLTEQLAMDAMKLNGRLFITPATVLADKDDVTLLSLDDPEFRYIDYAKGMKWQICRVDSFVPQYETKDYGRQLKTIAFVDSIAHPQVQECFLDIDYKADVAMAFLGNEMIADDIWNGGHWTIALNRFHSLLGKEPITLRFRPKGKELDIRRIRIIPEYKFKLK